MNIRECVKCGKAIYGEVYYSTSAGYSHIHCKSNMGDGGAGEIHIERPVGDLRFDEFCTKLCAYKRNADKRNEEPCLNCPVEHWLDIFDIGELSLKELFAKAEGDARE